MVSKHPKKCRCSSCQVRKWRNRKNADKKNGINNTFARFSSNAKAWHDQQRREDKRYNDLCGEVIITKKDTDDSSQS